MFNFKIEFADEDTWSEFISGNTTADGVAIIAAHMAKRNGANDHAARVTFQTLPIDGAQPFTIMELLTETLEQTW